MLKERAVFWRVSAISNLRDGAVLYIPREENVKTGVFDIVDIALCNIYGGRNL